MHQGKERNLRSKHLSTGKAELLGLFLLTKGSSKGCHFTCALLLLTKSSVIYGHYFLLLCVSTWGNYVGMRWVLCHLKSLIQRLSRKEALAETRVGNSFRNYGMRPSGKCQSGSMK